MFDPRIFYDLLENINIEDWQSSAHSRKCWLHILDCESTISCVSIFSLFHEYFWKKTDITTFLLETIFYTTPQKIGLRSPPMNGAWLYLPPPRNETSVTRVYKRAPPWIGGELQRLRLTKSHRVGHLQRPQGDIWICDPFHLQGRHSFSLCMDFVHHPSFSQASQTIQRDAKATVAPNPGWISTSLCYISLFLGMLIDDSLVGQLTKVEWY